jgi:16S rRNA (cytidine1402-2'-O)-methyltransferase
MGKLYIVPTPIGNLGDITLRALETLKKVEMILAEDTRNTQKLLKHFEINTPMRSFHQHNEHKITDGIVDRLKNDELSYALVSDAGTPGISDPAYLLVKACVEMEIDVECLPGATAFVPALIESGFPTDRFVFEGFLPQKKGRLKRLQALTLETKTIILYESPYRILKLMEQICEILGNDRQLSVSREISKIFHETQRGTAQELLNKFKEKMPKGEFVVIIKSKNEEDTIE